MGRIAKACVVIEKFARLPLRWLITSTVGLRESAKKALDGFKI
jgi:hypothetical protein